MIKFLKYEEFVYDQQDKDIILTLMVDKKISKKFFEFVKEKITENFEVNEDIYKRYYVYSIVIYTLQEDVDFPFSEILENKTLALLNSTSKNSLLRALSLICLEFL